MGFFSELKDDLSQAVNTILPTEEDGQMEMEIESLLAGQTEQGAADAAEPEPVVEPMLADADAAVPSPDAEIGVVIDAENSGTRTIEDVFNEARELEAETGTAEEADLGVDLDSMLSKLDVMGDGVLTETADEAAATAEPLWTEAAGEASVSEEMPAVNEEPVETAPVPTPAPEIAEDVFSEAIAAAMTMPESDVRELPDDIELLDSGGSASDAFVSNALSGAPAEPVDPEPQVFVNHHQEVKKMEQQVVQQLSAPTDENAVITAGMRIDGDVTTSGSLDVIGKINGNVTANGKLSVTGSLAGNLNAAEIYAENARITGEVRSQGAAKIGQSTVIIGNIYATSAVIAGAVKGDIDVHGPVVLDTTAIVMGNIKSQSVQINNGAVVEGMCSQSYAEVNPQAFFDGLDD